MKKILYIGVICLFCSISVFSQSKKKWEKTQALNSIADYRYFIARYPDGKYTELAKQQLDQLEFYNAQEQNTIKSYENYLRMNPEGKNCVLAKQNIEQLEFLNATQQNTVNAYEDYLKLHPDGKNSGLAKQSIEQLEFLYANQQNTVKAYEFFLKKCPDGKNSELAKQRFDQQSFKESEILNSEKAYESYLSKFPNGQSASIAISKLKEIRLIYARETKTVKAYEHFINLYPDEENAEQLRKELPKLSKYEESRKLGEVALRMAPVGAISFTLNPFGGTMQARATEIEFPSTLKEEIATFRKMINDGLDPNLIRIHGFEPAGTKDIGNGLAIFSSGKPGEIVPEDEEGMTLLEYFTAIKLDEACKILQLKKQK